jgi:hypothetical protein
MGKWKRLRVNIDYPDLISRFLANTGVEDLSMQKHTDN